MSHKVTVYSTTTCPYCHMAMDFLKENKVDFESVNLSVQQDRINEMIQLSGQTGVPVIKIDDQVIIGFDRPAIKKALGI